MIVEEGKYYLYRHIRLDTGEPFYIGIGTKEYVNSKNSYRRAFTKTRNNKIWKSVVEKTEYEVEILLESDYYEFIKQKEIEFIALHGRKNIKTGTLVNLTDGGEGNLGWIPSEETRALWSSQRKGLLAGENHPFYGIPRTEEQKKHASDLMKEKYAGSKHPLFGIKGEDHPNFGKRGELNPLFGRKLSKERCEKISEQNKDGGNPASIEVVNTLTKEEFSCIKLGALSVGLTQANLSRMLNGERRNSTYFVYKKDYDGSIVTPEPKPTSNIGHKVINTITGTIYNSITEASEREGFNRKTLSKYLRGIYPNKSNLILLK